MGKQIVKLGVDPFHIGLADQPCSLFVDPRTRDILIDEGEGDGRLNGVVLYADKEPRFDSVPLPETGAQLLISYCKHLLVLGAYPDTSALHEWARAVNESLASKHESTTEEADAPRVDRREEPLAAAVLSTS